MQNLLTWQYWFTVNPVKLSSLGFYLLGGFMLLLILIGVLAILKKRRGGLYRGLFNSIYNYSLTNFIIGLIVLFFNYENIPFFSARFWFIIWFIENIIFLFFIYKKLKKIPARKMALELEKERKKYLP